MGGFRTNDLDPGGDSVGEATSASSSSIAIPTLTNGDKPERCRILVSGTQDSYISITNGAGTVTTTNGMLVQAESGAVIVKTYGRTHINHIEGGTGEIFNVTPLNP